ncbi:s-adenosyl-methyltransferase [Plasmopara halstedii]|uniref:S-adenosyl-methyltransferase n=1 Tax=Plasmopara halstedii TaxID=4781 RepID=A0A0N7L4N5_PLAHL|nr:s-adenosyl-methyltransferase [Plasmopara halstedii]CEG39171.1 s-adenosyl-methyltransferase [Plasmopara halstedii]|eukprot:XP_024575540.1 s-adenosyl-methyltransferase [Plasmopara halstedii]
MLLVRRHVSRALNLSSLSSFRSSSSYFTDKDADNVAQYFVHVPVLFQETIAAFSRDISDTVEPRYFVDGTTGFGGHAKGLLQHFPRAHLLCIDRDPEVLSIAQANLADFHDRVSFQLGSYANLDKHLQAAAFPDEIDGILVDLGANSYHFDAAKRGFSVINDGPLDMRFNQQDVTQRTAADVVNSLSEVQLTRIFKDYGEERLAKEFAKAIVREREERDKVFQTTKELRECIERIANMWNSKHSRKKNGKRSNRKGGSHPATRCFQALRIYVNDELDHVNTGVKQLVNHLKPRGRLVTIAFHSLEDRPIKKFFCELDRKSRIDNDEDEDEEWDGEDTENDENVGIFDLLSTKRFRLIRRKAIKASDHEIATNSRSRSARLRCIERLS